MKSVRQLRLFLIGSAIALSFAASSVAHAQGLYVLIDCNGVGGLPDWSHTKTGITVSVDTARGFIELGTKAIPASVCAWDSFIIPIPGDITQDEFRYVKVEALGNDAFWIDNIEVWDSCGPFTFGLADGDGLGYTLSTQASDGNNPYSYDGVARRFITLYRQGPPGGFCDWW